jgi:hypothetical protein
VTGLVLGVLYGFITMRFALGPFGVVPTFNMPMGAAPPCAADLTLALRIPPC